MNDWFSDASHWLYAFFVTLVSAVAWWIRRQINRLDDQEDRIESLEKDHVTRQEIRDMQNHIDSTVRSSEERLAARIDRIYEKLN